MIKNALNIDDKDAMIIQLYMDDPDVSQKVIADKLKLSQPSVFVRVQKLKTKGLIYTRTGINFSKTKLFMARIDLTSKDPNGLLNEVKKCPYFVNGFIVSGENNVSVMLAHESLQKIDEIVNKHMRSKDNVSNVKLNIIVSTAKDYLFQMNLNLNEDKNCLNNENCDDCDRINISS
jgi:Lrp/AsnC family transcriptional regulator, leucine-responsive regulatory protein